MARLDAAPFGRFFHWWLGELAGLVPSRLRAAVAGDGQAVVLETGHGLAQAAARLSLRSRKGSQPLGEIEGDTVAAQRQSLRELLRRVRRGRSYVLRLPDSQVLHKTLRLPLAALENLHEVVGFEMDRQTPFGSKDVHYACHPVRTHRDAARVDVAVALVPKRTAEEALALAHAWGFSPDRVTALAEGEEVTLLLPGGERQGRAARAFVAVLGVVAVTLAVAAVALPLWQKQQVLQALEGRMEGAMAAARAATVLQDRVAAYHEGREVLQQRHRGYADRSLLLDELTRRLPDDSFLTRLVVEEGRLWMTGLATSASGLIRFLEDSPVLESVTFESPVERDQETALERFSISARLVVREEP